MRGIFLPLLFVVMYPMAVGAKDYTLLFYLFVCSGKSFLVYEFIHALFVGVFGVHVMEIEDGGVGCAAVGAGKGGFEVVPLLFQPVVIGADSGNALGTIGFIVLFAV